MGWGMCSPSPCFPFLSPLSLPSGFFSFALGPPYSEEHTAHTVFPTKMRLIFRFLALVTVARCCSGYCWQPGRNPGRRWREKLKIVYFRCTFGLEFPGFTGAPHVQQVFFQKNSKRVFSQIYFFYILYSRSAATLSAWTGLASWRGGSARTASSSNTGVNTNTYLSFFLKKSLCQIVLFRAGPAAPPLTAG